MLCQIHVNHFSAHRGKSVVGQTKGNAIARVVVVTRAAAPTAMANERGNQRVKVQQIRYAVQAAVSDEDSSCERPHY